MAVARRGLQRRMSRGPVSWWVSERVGGGQRDRCSHSQEKRCGGASLVPSRPVLPVLSMPQSDRSRRTSCEVSQPPGDSENSNTTPSRPASNSFPGSNPPKVTSLPIQRDMSDTEDKQVNDGASERQEEVAGTSPSEEKDVAPIDGSEQAEPSGRAESADKVEDGDSDAAAPKAAKPQGAASKKEKNKAPAKADDESDDAYKPGDSVQVKILGYPWWPAVVRDSARVASKSDRSQFVRLLPQITSQLQHSPRVRR